MLPTARQPCYLSCVRVLVTGATGFVGGALAHRLRALGHELHALARASSDAQPLHAISAIVHAGDIGDPNTVTEAAAGCEVVYHCAGVSALHAAPTALSWINVAGTENVIAAARHAGVERVVLLSCADVSLCNRDRLHWKEDAVLGHAPLGTFARSKLLAEELALHASDAALCVTALRPAFLWGPGDRTNLPGLCAEGLRGGVRLHGGGDNLFATTYVDNLVEAMIAAATAPGVGGSAFHVADADMLTAREFFEQLSAAVGLPAPRAEPYSLAYARAWLRRAQHRDGAWPEDVARRGRACLLDCLRAIRTLGYAPVASVEQGMQALAAWAKRAGGPQALAGLGRRPASERDAAHHERLAGQEPSNSER
ncbi:MAG: NAD-dependent epimerase/dehydratase family protein [Polyangiales bacterium]